MTSSIITVLLSDYLLWRADRLSELDFKRYADQLGGATEYDVKGYADVIIYHSYEETRSVYSDSDSDTEDGHNEEDTDWLNAADFDNDDEVDDDDGGGLGTRKFW